jgi:hypothetical protein
VKYRALKQGTLVRPMMIAPALRQFATHGLSFSAMRSLNAARRGSCVIDIDFDCDGYAMEGTDLVPSLERSISFGCSRKRLLGEHIDHSIDAGVDLFQALESACNGLLARNLTRLDGIDLVAGPPSPHFICHQNDPSGLFNINSSVAALHNYDTRDAQKNCLLRGMALLCKKRGYAHHEA